MKYEMKEIWNSETSWNNIMKGIKRQRKKVNKWRKK